MRFLPSALTIMIVAQLTLCSCEGGGNGPHIEAQHSVRLFDAKYGNGVFLGMYHTLDFKDGKICAFTPLRLYRVDDTLGLVSDTVIGFSKSDTGIGDLIERGGAVRFSADARRVIFVHSTYPDVSDGSLNEYDLFSSQSRMLLDSSYHIASMCYGNGDTIFVYSYGSTTRGLMAGYYIYSQSASHLALVYPYLSPLGHDASVAFDVSARTGEMYIPVLTGEFKSQIYLKNYFLCIDSMLVDLGGNPQAPSTLSLRLNSTQTRIAFALTPRVVLSSVAFYSEPSCLGVLDLASLRTTFYSPKLEGDFHAVYTSPCWNDRGDYLLFGYSSASREGRISHYFSCASIRVTN